MALVRMKPPVGVSVGLGADKKLYYVDDKGYANVDSGSVTKLTGEGWVSAVPVAPEAPGNNFAVMASKDLTGRIQSSIDGLFSSERNDVVLDGDSITARYINGSSTDATSYFAWYNAMMGQAFRVIGCAAVSGQDSSACLARFDANVATKNPAWVSLMIGINNAGSPDQVIADITAYIAKVRAINARLLLWTVLPSGTVGSDDAKRGGWSKINNWIMSLQGRFNDIIVIPAHLAWLDSALSTYFSPLAGLYSTDDGLMTHPTVKGGQRIGKLAKTVTNGIIRPGRVGTPTAIPWARQEIVINPLGSGSDAVPTAPLTGNLPTYWSAARESGSNITAACSVVARTDGIPGTYVRAAFSGATTGERFAVTAGNRGAGTTLADSTAVTKYRRYLVPGRSDLEAIALASGTTSTNVAGTFSNAIVGGLYTNGVQFLVVEAIVVGATYQFFAEVEFESGGTGAANVMLAGAVQNASFANLIQPCGLFNDGTAYDGITGEQITDRLTICSQPFVMPAGYAYFPAAVRVWSAAGSSGAIRIYWISLVRVYY